MTHTPGPWEVMDEAGDLYIIGQREWSGATPVIARVRQYLHGEPAGTDEANARLIAAAPDLLEVAKEALATIEYMPRAAQPERTRELLRAVITKVEGEQS